GGAAGDRNRPNRLDDRPHTGVRSNIRSSVPGGNFEPAQGASPSGDGRRAAARQRRGRPGRRRPDGRGDGADDSCVEASGPGEGGPDRDPGRRQWLAERARGGGPRRPAPQPGDTREPDGSGPRRRRRRGRAPTRPVGPLARPGRTPSAPGIEPAWAQLCRPDRSRGQGSQAAGRGSGYRRGWSPAVLLGADGQEHRPRRDQPAQSAQPNPGGRVRAEARTDLSRFRLGGTMPATVIEKEAEAKTSQKVSVDGSRRDPGTASPVLDGAHAPVMDGAQPAFLDSRTLLSLQATAGHAAGTSVVEAAKRSGSNGQSASSRPAPGAARQLGTAHTFEAKPPPSASASAVAETLVPGEHEPSGESAPEAAGGGALAGATVAAEPQAAPAAAAAPGESDGELAALDTAVAAPDSAAATGPEIAEGAAAEERPAESADAQPEPGGEASAESAAGAGDAPEAEQEEPVGSGEAAGPAETGAASE